MPTAATLTDTITLARDGMQAREATLAVPPGGMVRAVVQGESVDSLGFAYGHAAETIWNHPRNQVLREKRGDPRVLYPGDEIFIPPLRPAEFTGESTGRCHVYVRQHVPSLLRFRPLVFGKASPGVVYEVRQGGLSFGKGVTTADGDIEFEVSPDEARVSVRVFFDGFSKEYDVTLRTLDPIMETSGVQQRLAAMGFFHGAIDGSAGPALDAAVSRFRMHYGLHQGSGLDDRLRDAIHRQFGG